MKTTPYPTLVTAFYKFISITENDLPSVQKKLHDFGDTHDMHGLVLLAKEGINGTVCADPSVIAQWQKLLQETLGDIVFKDSQAKSHVFPRWYVKIRKEIVNLHMPNVAPEKLHTHVTPEEWNRMIEEEDTVIIDTRNDYETEVGMFKGAVDPNLKNFQEFPEYVRTCGIPKEKKVMMYCTGGIRCEKAILEMEKQGYKHVYQLEGGILSYLKKFPHKKFDGECFVFDHRVSVDQELLPSSRYILCPHCGDPGDKEVICGYCNKDGTVCVRCDAKGKNTCSKNCQHHCERLGCRK
jgi:UPF0176 protein